MGALVYSGISASGKELGMSYSYLGTYVHASVIISMPKGSIFYLIHILSTYVLYVQCTNIHIIHVPNYLHISTQYDLLA